MLHISSVRGGVCEVGAGVCPERWYGYSQSAGGGLRSVHVRDCINSKALRVQRGSVGFEVRVEWELGSVESMKGFLCRVGGVSHRRTRPEGREGASVGMHIPCRRSFSELVLSDTGFFRYTIFASSS